MSSLNIQCLQWMAAGDEPAAWPLFIAWLSALWGAWACAAALAWVAWKRAPERGYLATVVAGAILASLLSHAIAAHFNVPRPFVAGWVPAYISHRASAATPSTHATVMFFIAFALLFRESLRRLGGAMLAMACIVGWARVYVGVHFPLDILAGITLAAAQAGLLSLAWKQFFPAPEAVGSQPEQRRHLASAFAPFPRSAINQVGRFGKTSRFRCVFDRLHEEFLSRH